jgi:hypothetical protein
MVGTPGVLNSGQDSALRIRAPPPPCQPFYRGAKGWPGHVAKAPPICPKGVVIELKREIVERKGG